MDKWNQFKVTESKKFGYQVPSFTPSIFREFRGEIFTTYHSEEHPVMNYIHYNKEELSIHGRFSRSYKGVLRGLHYDNKTWKLVQALVGEIYLVVLDARPSSLTYGAPCLDFCNSFNIGRIIGASVWSILQVSQGSIFIYSILG